MRPFIWNLSQMRLLHVFITFFQFLVTTKVNEYFTMAILDNTAIVEGRDANGNQFYGDYKTAPLKIKPGEWNSVPLQLKDQMQTNQMVKFASM